MCEDNLYQRKYWNELVQLKTHILYLEEFLLQTKSTDRKLNAFLAVTSSGSICSWAVWQQYQFVWAFIIAAFQLINAIKAFLPYKKRLQAIGSLLHDLDELFLIAERRWFDVSEGNLTQQEIHKLRLDIKQKKTRTLHKHLGSTVLPQKKTYLNKAMQDATRYFKNFYFVEA